MYSYQKARAKMIRHEKQFREQLEYTTKELNMLEGISELGPSELASVIIKAASEVQLYVKKRGFDGYLYDTERVRQNLANGFSSKGKVFQGRFYRLTALDLGIELFDKYTDKHGRGYIYNLLVGASHKDPNSIDHLAHILNWSRKYSPNPTRAGDNRSKPFSNKSKFAGSRYERKPEPPKAPIIYSRRVNEWAYKQAKVSTQLISLTETWNEILDVDPKASWKEIKTAMRKLAFAHHSDAGSEWADDVVMQRVLAAYDIAKKIYNRK